MGTQKRERQKANRLQRQIEEHRADRISTVKRNTIRGVIVLVLALAIVIAIAWVGGAFDSADEPDVTLPTTTLPAEPVVTTTIPVFETPEKPVVEIPDEIPTELVVTVLQEGEGPEAAAGDTVWVHYIGVRSEDGAEFDNSYDRDRAFPVQVGVGQVIQGWDQGLIGVQAGERLQLDIPSDLAYGDSPNGDIIQAGDALTFVIDVMAVDPAASE